ncbi:hypothetical protein EYC80_006225 [Monilinia laxa]|uniref:Uncharacterized protein n=1 Tax=Monilinia laxa TaxID=61186 RepID=A0A5N6KH42_MONLA|nr:hypothetical protein EYC80_006225 [Monilinia laxa]
MLYEMYEQDTFWVWLGLIVPPHFGVRDKETTKWHMFYLFLGYPSMPTCLDQELPCAKKKKKKKQIFNPAREHHLWPLIPYVPLDR